MGQEAVVGSECSQVDLYARITADGKIGVLGALREGKEGSSVG